MPGAVPGFYYCTREADQLHAVYGATSGSLILLNFKITDHEKRESLEISLGGGLQWASPRDRIRAGATLRPLIIKDPEFPDNPQTRRERACRQGGSTSSGLCDAGTIYFIMI